MTKTKPVNERMSSRYIRRGLREFRARRDITASEMAVDLGVSPSFLSAIENGRKALPPAFTKKIALAYRLSANEAEELEDALLGKGQATINRLSAEIGDWSDEEIQKLRDMLIRRAEKRKEESESDNP